MRAKATKALSPLRVGNEVLIRTVTMFHTGRIVGLTDTEVVLTDAAWISETGRFADVLKKGGKDALDEVEPFGDRAVSVNRGAIVDVTDWTGGLPAEQK